MPKTNLEHICVSQGHYLLRAYGDLEFSLGRLGDNDNESYEALLRGWESMVNANREGLKNLNEDPSYSAARQSVDEARKMYRETRAAQKVLNKAEFSTKLVQARDYLQEAIPNIIIECACS